MMMLSSPHCQSVCFASMITAASLSLLFFRIPTPTPLAFPSSTRGSSKGQDSRVRYPCLSQRSDVEDQILTEKMDFAFLGVLTGSPTGNHDVDDQGEFRNWMNEYRKNKIRRPDLMIKKGLAALKARGHSGVDKWTLLEALFLAAIDVGDASLARQCLGDLEKEFPDSVRVGVLRGRMLELEGKFTEALKWYDSLLKQQMHNIDVMRRLVCTHKQSGNTKLAVEHLHKILAVYQSDAGSWFELSEIHIAFGEYEEAAHCCEELVMLKPTSCVYHNRLADVYYSMGGEENLLLARKHYTMSLNYQAPEINVHAVYGLRATSELLELEIKGKEGKSESMTKNTGKNESNGANTNAVSDSEVNKELLSFAVDKLTSMGIA